MSGHNRRYIRIDKILERNEFAVIKRLFGDGNTRQLSVAVKRGISVAGKMLGRSEHAGFIATLHKGAG